ncbi:hypothetical protein [Sphingomonas sp.]|uniref:hypothetical protein n=1 Tax=Sphingomonas sp. TaxID=28214 RepID=UPI002DD61DC7|nr:hypothetical protein [Sphingomonas sp.]
MIDWVAEQYRLFIMWIGDGTGLPDTVLHIHAGLAVLMLARIVTRRSLGSIVPWSIVLAAELGNEVMDRIIYGSWRWDDTINDIAHTMFWPTVICLGVRFRPLIAARKGDGTAPEDVSRQIAGSGLK